MHEIRELTLHEQFLQVALDTALAKGIISTRDIMAKFPPSEIMRGFEERPDRRADLLEKCMGMKRQSAARIQPEAAGELLSVALDESDTNSDQVWEILTSSDLVRHQFARQIWELVFATRWPDRPTKEHKEMMAELLKAAIRLHLLDNEPTKANTYYEMIKAVGVDQFMSNRIPAEKRAEILKSALSMGEDVGKPFCGEDLFQVLSPDYLAERLELPVLERVLIKIAAKYGWIDSPAEAETQSDPDFHPDDVATSELADPSAPEPEEVLELDAEMSSGVHPDSTLPPVGDGKDVFGNLGPAPGEPDAPSPGPMFAAPSATAALDAMAPPAHNADEVDAVLTGLGIPPSSLGSSASRTPRSSSAPRAVPPPPPPPRGSRRNG